jgi:hypothetical protein
MKPCDDGAELDEEDEPPLPARAGGAGSAAAQRMERKRRPGPVAESRQHVDDEPQHLG